MSCEYYIDIAFKENMKSISSDISKKGQISRESTVYKVYFTWWPCHTTLTGALNITWYRLEPIIEYIQYYFYVTYLVLLRCTAAEWLNHLIVLLLNLKSI